MASVERVQAAPTIGPPDEESGESGDPRQRGRVAGRCAALEVASR
jgi:hypothetical protein